MEASTAPPAVAAAALDKPPVAGPAVQPPAPAAALAEYHPEIDAYMQYWAVVQQDPADFNGWTNLITCAEKLDDIEKIRSVYDHFFVEYPLCYGYWKKYADCEARHAGQEAAIAVYERGVAATPYSADLWCHYAAYKKSLEGTPPDDVRGIYERALAYCGTDYGSSPLWDKYFAFEQEQASILHVVSLYSRVLACPVKDLERYHTSFKSYTHGLTSDKLMSGEELDALRTRILEDKAVAYAARRAAREAEAAAKAEAEAKAKAEAEAKAKAEAAAREDMAEEGEVQEPSEEERRAAEEAEMRRVEEEERRKAEEAAEAAAASTASEEEIRGAWFRVREDYVSHARRELALRKPFEDGIRRPYFHVKPLDATQLHNWAKYLDFVEARGDQTATIMLFERCLVSCASYPEFWMRYVRYLEASDKVLAKAALDRAVLVYCKRRPEVHLFAAAYDERHGDVEGARERFKHLLEVLAPKLLEAVTAAANFERRQGNKDAAIKYYDELLQEEKAKEGSRVYPFLAAHYAQYLRQHCGDVAKAREVFDEAVSLRPEVRALWESAIHFEEQVAGSDPEAVKRALDLYDKCTTAPKDSSKGLPERDREELSLRSLDFADAYCADAAAVAVVASRHAHRFLLPTSVTAEAKAAGSKRPGEGPGAAGAPPAKAARLDYPPASVPPPAGGAPPAYPGYGYPGYGYSAYPGYGYGYGY